MDVAIFSGSKNDPASRFRYRQHSTLLKRRGIDLYDYQAKYSQYPPATKLKRPYWFMQEVIHRYKQIIDANSQNFDLYIIQREMLATLCSLEMRVRPPKIFDLDDAVWVRQRFKGVDKILNSVDSVICGNQYIADYVLKFNKNIFVIPTAVDITRFCPIDYKADENIVIGWSGSSSGYESVYEIERSLSIILRKYDNVKLLITSNTPPKFTQIPIDRYLYVPWSSDNEVEIIQHMDIGLMPLKNTPFNKGKCSYKMLLYMSCGLPVVVTPIGMNCEVLSKGEVGFGAISQDDWVCSLETLIERENLRIRMGRNARKIVIEHYSSEVITDLISNAFYLTCN